MLVWWLKTIAKSMQFIKINVIRQKNVKFVFPKK